MQAEIVYGLSPDGKGVTVVGDDAQSIYSFRAATVRNILDLPERYPGTKVITLEQNYRSTQPILDATNRVIALAAERFAKNLWSEREQGAVAGAGHVRGRGRAGGLRDRQDPGAPRGGRRLAAAGRAVSRVAPQHDAGGGTDAPGTFPFTSTAG